MKLEVFNRSKYRDGSAPGDDVPLAVPGVVFGVFDGATDPLGTVIDGVAAGRLAALTVAAEMTAIALDPAARNAPGDQIIARLSSVLKARTDPLDLKIPPSTTIAAALDCGHMWRFLLLGDSAVRLNGTEVHHHEKIIDHVSTVARVALFNTFADQTSDRDRVENMTRRGIFLGLEKAICEGAITSECADGIVADAIAATGLEAVADIVRAFLMDGIQRQFAYGNALGNPLCFDTLNGALPQRGDLQDFTRAKADITSIEVYTDGYPAPPPEISVAGWEAAFHAAEATDFHKIRQFATVKGSTSTEFYDDRAVVVLT
ncbi:hypothetical protein CEP88_09385 [Roseobacter denitrificans]|uniref:PPM-type phosphatase domain-containing protein n=1 Tax=Roseobacter denitrificans (strain ATCC 33942 / OCh 114) TaxID=375451 RepID=Q160W7_ROSDO|nr:hypothetical protein [Roseobacter denitrificans]ABG33476.1 conserved hypothetical protein [Roseobacter denitrificans OCh 114]AVL52792.1 hypothetical protein CEP88_09385 [Roseobacter denitrificans]SFG05460.1 hypothetical protein SAMN05443635_106197 [Roseobacter denitrificans OCh 114]